MIRENLLAIAENNDVVSVTFYNDDEPIGSCKIIMSSIEDYDDEIIIRGMYNDFVIINCSTLEITIDEYDIHEFIFRAGQNKIGLSFMPALTQKNSIEY